MKKITSLLLAFMLLVTFLPSAYATESGYTYELELLETLVPTDYTSVKGVVSVSNVSGSATQADTLLAIAYSDKNELLDISATPVSFDTEGTENYEFQLSSETEISTVKTFIWDSWQNISPLCQAFEFTPVPNPLANYAIVLRYESGYNLSLLLANGTRKVFDANDIHLNSADDALLEACADADNVEDRVIEYTVKSSTGELINVTRPDATEIYGEYNFETHMLDVSKITDDTTIIDATCAYEEYRFNIASVYYVYDNSFLSSDAVYYGFSFSNSLISSPFIVLSSISKSYGASTRFAVALKVYENAVNEDGDDIDEVDALYEGAKPYLVFEDGLTDYLGLGVGDVFLFETNSDGEIDEAYILYDKSENEFCAFNNVPEDKYYPDEWSFSLIDSGINYQLVRGIVVDVSDTDITFADYKDDLSIIDTNTELSAENLDGVVTYGFADGLKAYIYDSDSDETKEIYKFKSKLPSSIKASNFDRFDIDGDGVYTEAEYPSSAMEDYANEAIALIADGDIVDIFVIEK